MILSSVLCVFLVLTSPVIVFSNILIISVWIRYKRLRTPSSLLIVSLSACDLGLGLLIPSAITIDFQFPEPYVEFSSHESVFTNSSSTVNSTLDGTQGISRVCDNPMYCFHVLTILVLSSMSLLSIVAIALDRFLSVSEPLRYNHFVTMSHVKKFLIASSIYLCLLYLIPISYLTDVSTADLIFYAALVVYLPCLLLVFGSYSYIYVIARSHARQIISVEISLHDIGNLSHTVVTNVTASHQHRYGITLGLLISDILCWGPIHAISAIDVLSDSNILHKRHWRLLAVSPIGLSVLMNPWLYAYRSSEVRNAILRILDSILCKLTGRSSIYTVSVQNKNGEISDGSNVRLLAISPTPTPTTGTVPPGSHGPEGTGSNLQILGGSHDLNKTESTSQPCQLQAILPGQQVSSL